MGKGASTVANKRATLRKNLLQGLIKVKTVKIRNIKQEK